MPDCRKKHGGKLKWIIIVVVVLCVTMIVNSGGENNASSNSNPKKVYDSSNNNGNEPGKDTNSETDVKDESKNEFNVEDVVEAFDLKVSFIMVWEI